MSHRTVSTPVLAGLFLLLSAAMVTAESPAAIPAGMTRSDRVALERGERITSFFSSASDVSLLPPTAFSETIIGRLHDLSPRLGVEALTLMRIPAETRSRPDFSLRLYNILRSISTMEGIEYFSASRNQMREFYIESYTVDDPSTRRRVPDALVPAVPADDTVFAFQRDSTFGRNVYEITYREENGLVWMRMINRTRMSYGIIPLVGEGNLEIHLLVIPVEDGILLYGACGVRLLGTFGMQDRAQASFQNRIEAIFGWFAVRLEREFG